jgi:hypothetical protein
MSEAQDEVNGGDPLSVEGFRIEVSGQMESTPIGPSIRERREPRLPPTKGVLSST